MKYYIKTTMHSSRMRTARLLPYRGWGLCPGGLRNKDPPGQRLPPLDRDPSDRDPNTETPHRDPLWTETLLDRDSHWTETPWTETQPPRQRHPLQQRLLLDRDPPGHVTCGACWDRDPCEQNDTQV